MYVYLIYVYMYKIIHEIIQYTVLFFVLYVIRTRTPAYCRTLVLPSCAAREVDSLVLQPRGCGTSLSAKRALTCARFKKSAI